MTYRILDVAQQAGVSKSTVSRVLNRSIRSTLKPDGELSKPPENLIITQTPALSVWRVVAATSLGS